MRSALLLVCLLATACAGTAPLPAPAPLPPEVQADREAKLAKAREDLPKNPDDPRLYRHRGHRYITVRDLGPAILDFEKAARLIEGRPDEVESDGLPNSKNIPT